MKFLALIAFFSAPALASPTMYIDIGSCQTKGRPESSFKVMVDGMTADKVGNSSGLLLFKELEDPSDPAQTMTMAISATIERLNDGSFLFENLLISFPGTQKIALKPGAETQSTVGNFNIICRGKKLE